MANSCTSCHTPVPDDAVVCPACGAAVPTRMHPPGAPGPASSPGGTGLTGMFLKARSQAAQHAPAGRPSSTAVMKAFVKLASERSSRRMRRTVGAVAVVGALAVLLVFALAERRARSLEGQLRALNTELTGERGSRAALEAQLAELSGRASEWMAAAESPSQGLGDFGPTVTQRYAAGIALIELVSGFYSESDDTWLRFSGRTDSVRYTTRKSDPLVVHDVGSCSGALIDPEGWILTNRHCVDLYYPDAQAIRAQSIRFQGTGVFRPTVARMRVVFPPNRVFDVDLGTLRHSSEHDVALLRTTTRPQGVPVLPLARGRSPTVGEDIVMMGFPGGPMTTARRRGLGDVEDASLRTALADEAERLTDEQVRQGGLERAVRRLTTADPEWFWRERPTDAVIALVRRDPMMFVVLRNLWGIRNIASLEALVRLREVQPLVVGNMTISDVTDRTFVYQTLGGIGGSSGGPVLGRDLAIIGLNHRGFAEEDRGSQYQENHAVRMEYVWRFLPRGIGRQR